MAINIVPQWYRRFTTSKILAIFFGFLGMLCMTEKVLVLDNQRNEVGNNTIKSWTQTCCAAEVKGITPFNQQCHNFRSNLYTESIKYDFLSNNIKNINDTDSLKASLFEITNEVNILSSLTEIEHILPENIYALLEKNSHKHSKTIIRSIIKNVTNLILNSREKYISLTELSAQLNSSVDSVEISFLTSIFKNQDFLDIFILHELKIQTEKYWKEFSNKSDLKLIAENVEERKYENSTKDGNGREFEQNENYGGNKIGDEDGKKKELSGYGIGNGEDFSKDEGNNEEPGEKDGSGEEPGEDRKLNSYSVRLQNMRRIKLERKQRKLAKMNQKRIEELSSRLCDSIESIKEHIKDIDDTLLESYSIEERDYLSLLKRTLAFIQGEINYWLNAASKSPAEGQTILDNVEEIIVECEIINHHKIMARIARARSARINRVLNENRVLIGNSLKIAFVAA